MSNYLSDGQMRRVRVNKPDYEWAVQVVQGVPWAALAGVHYRESEFDRVMHGEEAACGPFALDPGGIGVDLRERIIAYVMQVCRLYHAPLADINQDFRTASLVAAHELKSKAIGPLQDEGGGTHLDILADALFGYNGRSKRYSEYGQTGSGDEQPSWQWSPYVSNDPLGGHALKIFGTVPDSTQPGGRRHISRADVRPGALVIYKEVLSRAQELCA